MSDERFKNLVDLAQKQPSDFNQPEIEILNEMGVIYEQLQATNKELLSALEEAMEWNWLEDEPPPEHVRKQCEEAITNAKQRGQK